MNADTYYKQSIENIEKIFNTKIYSGLTGQQATEKLAADGYNEFEKKKHKSRT